MQEFLSDEKKVRSLTSLCCSMYCIKCELKLDKVASGILVVCLSDGC